jgi:hypothetical protein
MPSLQTAPERQAREGERIMKRIIAIAAAACIVFGGGVAMAKGPSGMPKNWKMNFETDVPKNLLTGGDACTKVTAIMRNLDQPFSDPLERNKPEMSRRERMSGGGQYGDPKDLKNWIEFRVRETCGNKRLWAQIWAKTGLSGNYSFAVNRRCPGWTMKQNYLTPVQPNVPAGVGTYLYMDAYNYPPTPKSVEVRLWDAKDFEGQAKGTGTCPK